MLVTVQAENLSAVFQPPLYPMRPLLRSALLVVLALTAARAADSTAPRLELRDGDRVVFLGDTLIEREQ